MVEKDAEAIVEWAWEPENALNILIGVMANRSAAHRANGKSMTTAYIDMALYRAMEALKKEIKAEKEEKSFWEELQLMLYDTTNAQAEAAIKILQEKLAKNQGTSCDHLNENRIWVSQEVYERLINNPKGVVVESVCKAPILVKTRTRKARK